MHVQKAALTEPQQQKIVEIFGSLANSGSTDRSSPDAIAIAPLKPEGHQVVSSRPKQNF